MSWPWRSSSDGTLQVKLALVALIGVLVVWLGLTLAHGA
jgi:hypothetical protein